MALRFANALFEPLWNADAHRPRADHRRRDGRRRKAAAATTTRPARCATWCRTTCCSCSASSRWSRRSSLDADAVRDEKLKVLRALKPIDAHEAPTLTRARPVSRRRDRRRAGAGLSRRARRQADSDDRDLRRAQGRDRQLALGRRAVLSAHRQAAAAARLRDRHRSSRRSRISIFADERRPIDAEPAGHPPAARRRRQAVADDQGSRARAACACATCRST